MKNRLNCKNSNNLLRERIRRSCRTSRNSKLVLKSNSNSYRKDKSCSNSRKSSSNNSSNCKLHKNNSSSNKRKCPMRLFDKSSLISSQNSKFNNWAILLRSLRAYHLSNNSSSIIKNLKKNHKIPMRMSNKINCMKTSSI